jgi:hypothetical protein
MSEYGENPEESVEQEIAEALQTSRERLGSMYDAAVSVGTSPIEQLRKQTHDFKDTREIYGEEYTAQLVAQLEAVREDDREAFLDSMMAIAEPMVRRQVTDPEIRSRIETLSHSDTVIVPTGAESEPHLEMRIHVLDTIREHGESIDLGGGETLQMGDTVMEISWPNTGTAPRGMKDVIKALRAMAEELSRRPEIKAVTAVSWMVSREGVMEALGFHTVADMKIIEDQRNRVVEWATSSRADKQYQRGVAGDEVKFAFQSRAEFLAKFGEHEA